MLNSISRLRETRLEQELFSGILGQPREVHLKFRNEIPENSVPSAPPSGVFGIFGWMESAIDCIQMYVWHIKFQG